MRAAFNSSVSQLTHCHREPRGAQVWGTAWLLRIGIVATDPKPPPHRGPCECRVESWGLHREGAQGQPRLWREVRQLEGGVGPWEGPDERAPGIHQGSQPLLPQNQTLQGQCACCVSVTSHSRAPGPSSGWYPRPVPVMQVLLGRGWGQDSQRSGAQVASFLSSWDSSFRFSATSFICC